MKKSYTIAIFVLIVAALTLYVSCPPTTGSEPTGVTLTAEEDTLVKISWTAPTEGTPDKYVVYFKAVGAANYTNVAEVTTTSYIHNPAGATGDYYVAAKYGSDEEDSDVKTTIPISTAAVTVGELNAAALSGYGWDRTTGTGATYSMTTNTNVTKVDFYLTNFAVGTATPYNIASPDQGPTDAGGVVPTGSWRVNGISDPITDPQAPLPKYISGTTYFNYTPINTYPTYLAVKTDDGYYGLIKVDGLNTTNATVQVSSWFQTVKGLRLIKH